MPVMPVTLPYVEVYHFHFIHFLALYGNSPFPSCVEPLYQSEAGCTTIHLRMSSDFNIKGWAPRLALTKIQKEIEKWPISIENRKILSGIWNKYKQE